MLLASTIKVLLIEDNSAEARFLQEILKGSKLKGFSLVQAKRLAEALDRLQQENFDVILLDLGLPDSQGLSSLACLREKASQLPIVVLTNTNDDELALEALRQGAQDYLFKRQINLDRLVSSLCYAIERKQNSEGLREVNELLTKRVEEQNAELVKVQKLYQLKSDFVAMFSHDFRNPMNTILLSAGLLETSKDQLTKKQELYCWQQIRLAIKNMDRLLSEVLLLGKSESGKLQYHPAPLDLERFCHQLLQSLQILTGETHQLVFTSQGQFEEWLWDESLLEHILNNLLINAIKYSPQGSEVRLELVAQPEKVTFRVCDRGIGIPESDRNYLFQPFYRATNVNKITGTGLGLVIVKRCVEVHGGQIAVESEIGEGTTFIITLPAIAHNN